MYNNYQLNLYTIELQQPLIYVGTPEYLEQKTAFLKFTNISDAIEYINKIPYAKNKIWTILILPNYLCVMPLLRNINIKFITDGLTINKQINSEYHFPYIKYKLDENGLIILTLNGDMIIELESTLTGEAVFNNGLICINSNILCIGIHFGDDNISQNNNPYKTLEQYIKDITGYAPTQEEIDAYITDYTELHGTSITPETAAQILLNQLRLPTITPGEIEWFREKNNISSDITDEEVISQILNVWPTSYYIDSLKAEYETTFLQTRIRGKIEIKDNSVCTLNHCRFYGTAIDSYNIGGFNNSIINIENCYCILTDELSGRIPGQEFATSLYLLKNSIANINTSDFSTFFKLEKYTNDITNNAISIIKNSSLDTNSNIHLSGFTSGVTVADSSVAYLNLNVYYSNINENNIFTHKNNGYDDISNRMNGFIYSKNNPILT